jgi:hypothetical protein
VKSLKARIISFLEVKDKFTEVITDLDRRPMNEELVVRKAGELLFLLGVCLSQMKASNAASYPEKNKHLSILQSAADAITYKINTCTIEEAKTQVNKAYMAFGVH